MLCMHGRLHVRHQRVPGLHPMHRFQSTYVHLCVQEGDTSPNQTMSCPHTQVGTQVLSRLQKQAATCKWQGTCKHPGNLLAGCCPGASSSPSGRLRRSRVARRTVCNLWALLCGGAEQRCACRPLLWRGLERTWQRPSSARPPGPCLEKPLLTGKPATALVYPPGLVRVVCSWYRCRVVLLGLFKVTPLLRGLTVSWTVLSPMPGEASADRQGTAEMSACQGLGGLGAPGAGAASWGCWS